MTPTPHTKPGSPAAQLTAREQAALTLRVPNSGTEWLDAMISESIIRDTGVTLLGAMLEHYGINDGGTPSTVHRDQIRAMQDAAFEAARTAVYWESGE